MVFQLVGSRLYSNFPLTPAAPTPPTNQPGPSIIRVTSPAANPFPTSAWRHGTAAACDLSDSECGSGAIPCPIHSETVHTAHALAPLCRINCSAAYEIAIRINPAPVRGLIAIRPPIHMPMHRLKYIEYTASYSGGGRATPTANRPPCIRQ